jgi:hypothetical protein
VSAPPTAGGEQADVWRERLHTDPTAIVALADHLLRTCGLAIRLGSPVDPAPLFEMQSALQGVPTGGPADEPLIRARQLLDGGAMALSGLVSGKAVAAAELPAMTAEMVAAVARGDDNLVRNLAPALLAGVVNTEALPPLPEIPDTGLLSCWFEAAMRIRQSRWG